MEDRARRAAALGPDGTRAVARWRLHARVAIAVGAAAEGLGAAALAGAAALLVLRTFGVVAVPHVL